MQQIKIGIVSDLHTEFWTVNHFAGIGVKVQRQLADADLILLAGDIDVGDRSVQTAQRLFPSQPVCLLAGNHEFYNHDYDFVRREMQRRASGTNITVLNRESWVTSLHDRAVRVLGVTLWTDFALLGTPVLSMLDARSALNDFRVITFGGSRLTPEDTLLWHQEDRAWLLDQLNAPFDGLTIVMTHHAPVSYAVAPKYDRDSLSPCFASRMDAELPFEKIDLLVWGHTHHPIDQTMIDQSLRRTRLISSQTGYPVTTTETETDTFGLLLTL